MIAFRKLGLLTALYVAEGLPFGFQATALPVFLRERGVSLAAIGFLSALSLPWLLKALWSPLVDRYGTKRKQWIIPMQLGIAVSCLIAAFLPEGSLRVLLALVFLMNCFAATMDIAVDGLAVDLLSSEELGIGNAGQVVGYKLGMLTGGGLLVYASKDVGWSGLFGLMSALLVVLCLAVSLFDEPERSYSTESSPSLREIVGATFGAMRAGAAWQLLVLVATYKIGEAMIDSMWKPFLVDHGVPAASIGLWVGTYGMVASLFGSMLGGIAATRVRLESALALFAALRVFPMLGQVWIALTEVTPTAVISVGCGEHFFGGAMTSVMFALMMSRVDPRIGATHYTVLASIEVLGKLPAGPIAGILSERLGFGLVAGLGTALSTAFVPFAAWAARSSKTPARPGG